MGAETCRSCCGGACSRPDRATTLEARISKAPLPRAVPVFLPVAIRFYHQLAQGVEVAVAEGGQIALDSGQKRELISAGFAISVATTHTSPSGALRGARGWSRELSAGSSGVVRELRRLVHLGLGDGAGRLGERHRELRGRTGGQHAGWGRGLAEVVQDALDHLLLEDEGEDLHRLAAAGTL